MFLCALHFFEPNFDENQYQVRPIALQSKLFAH